MSTGLFLEPISLGFWVISPIKCTDLQLEQRPILELRRAVQVVVTLRLLDLHIAAARKDIL